tara:strand:- start:1105 stop:1317 length:213 start_codon:yes stop_codon:yes gene_type:complete
VLLKELGVYNNNNHKNYYQIFYQINSPNIYLANIIKKINSHQEIKAKNMSIISYFNYFGRKYEKNLFVYP